MKTLLDITTSFFNTDSENCKSVLKSQADLTFDGTLDLRVNGVSFGLPQVSLLVAYYRQKTPNLLDNVKSGGFNAAFKPATVKTGSKKELELSAEQQIADIVKKHCDFTVVNQQQSKIKAEVASFYKLTIDYTEVETRLRDDDLDSKLSTCIKYDLIDEQGYLLKLLEILPACISEEGHTLIKELESFRILSASLKALGFTTVVQHEKGRVKATGTFDSRTSLGIALDAAEYLVDKASFNPLVNGFTARIGG